MNCIEEPFETAGNPLPRLTLINPLHFELLLKVEVAWNGLDKNIGALGPLQRSHYSAPPVVTTP